jgi:predicted nucleic acid-binding protein
MPKINLFLDSSALIAGIISASGAARVLLLLSETGHITITISEQVVAESERAIARKAPQVLSGVRQAILASKVEIRRDPTPEEVKAHLYIISHAPDVPIVLAAKHAKADYLVTLNRKHFIDDPEVSRQSGLRIGTPGDALAWVRRKISE